MNQSIIFSELVTWVPQSQVFEVSAMTTLGEVVCRVSNERLKQLSQETPWREEEWLDCFERHRFDIEELLAAKIVEQDFAEDGSIYLY